MRVFNRLSSIRFVTLFLCIVFLATLDLSRLFKFMRRQQYGDEWTSPQVAVPRHEFLVAPSANRHVQLDFVHIPKSGGTVIEYVASMANITWGLCHWKSRPSAGPGCHKPDWAMYGGMSWERWFAPSRALTAIESPYKNKKLFTVVRDPYERVLAAFYAPSNKSRGMIPTLLRTFAQLILRVKVPELTETPEALNKFLMECLEPLNEWRVHCLPQSDFVYDAEGGLMVDHVLKYELLREQFTELMKLYDMPVFLDRGVDQPMDDSTNNSRRLTVMDLFPETIERINEVAWQDFHNFGYKMIDPKRLAEQRAHEQTVSRIYYINLRKNAQRREVMESWLSNQPIPFERINAKVGSTDPEDCVVGKQNPDRCNGIVGLAESELDIIQNHNTSGLTLVFEDDFVMDKPLDEIVQRTLRLVPDDWDLIRWDCWGPPLDTFDVLSTGEVFRTYGTNRDTTFFVVMNWFCGGTHAMLWRDKSVSKLEQLWSKLPYDDIDCRLTTIDATFNSYCVNIGIGYTQRVRGERTDIPKINS